MNIVHLAIDEKFIDRAINVFETANPNQNKFLIISDAVSLKYIKSKTNVEVIKKKQIIEKKFITKLCKYDLIVFHSLPRNFGKLITLIPTNVKILWIGWGYDYYEHFAGGIKKYLAPKTYRYFFKHKIKTILFKPLRLVKNLVEGFNLKRIFSRIDYFAPVLNNEYELCRNNLSLKKAKYIDWQYPLFTNNKTDLGYIDDEASDILLGNSASYTCNHIEIIDLLFERKLSTNNKIIIPLSYGDNIYQKFIIDYAKKRFGNNVIPLVDFIPLTQYNKTISNCRYVIMNHLRQQAMGNIYERLLCGASVFLNTDNPAYDFCCKLGLKIFSIKDLEESNCLKKFNLDQQNMINNKEIILNNFCYNMSIKKTKRLISIIDDKKGIF